MSNTYTINREKIKSAFAEYIRQYDSEDPKVQLKVCHTYRVAELCEEIAKGQKCSQRACDFAWLSGMLHDVGRFEQLRKYGTFLDAKSVDHAGLSADLLFGNIKENTMGAEDICYPQALRMYVEESLSATECLWMEQVVRWHSAYELPQEMSGRKAFFANVLRDADKIDILRVNVETPLEQIYNVSTEELKNSVVTPEVIEAFAERHTILRSLKKTPVDHIVGHIALVFGLVFPESVQIVRQQGYLDRILSFVSDRKETREQFVQLQEIVREWYCQSQGQ